jgi:DNA polymerase III gamma/tau subunit
VNTLSVIGLSAVTITISPDSFAVRDERVALAKTIEQVTSVDELNAAVDCLRRLRALAKETEESRVAVKAPVLEMGKRIDSIAKDFVATITPEADRISRLVTAYQIEQDRIAREAEAQRQKAIREAQEAERRAREEAERERQRIEREAAEAKAKAQREAEAEKAKANNLFEGAMADAERKRAEEAVEKARREALAAEQQRIEQARAASVQVASSPVVAPVKVAGTRKLREPKYEITDLPAFAAAHPELVTITPNHREIIAHMRNLTPWEGRNPIAHAGTGGPVIAWGWWEEKLSV